MAIGFVEKAAERGSRIGRLLRHSQARVQRFRVKRPEYLRAMLCGSNHTYRPPENVGNHQVRTPRF